ncbi:zinc finger CCHC domain-containing protein 7-like [Saccostrea echinata]|uniref:zinc finger CCHC domain-containing protein 7-like n=1 Tax=Saccostrea echinata TaxID=191078 RepID=UPI002A83E08F|nr:zinc finger CCHC domain-containing protein 7-like [Saccostrea echinata]
MMESEEEESESSDLEEIENALYSQIHYNSYVENYNVSKNSQTGDSNSSAHISAHYDIDVKSTNSTCTYKPSESLSMVSLSHIKDKESYFLCKSQDSAIGMESFMSVNSTETSVVIETDSDDCNKEENSKVTEVLYKDKRSKLSSGKESVIEIDSDSEQEIDLDRKTNVILLSDSEEDYDDDMCNDSLYSDDMLLDEELSDMEGLHVNVDEEHQPKLSSAYDFEHHRKSWFIIDADKYGTVPQHAKSRYYGNKFDKCHNCKEHGHMANSCLKPSKLEICILCGFIGHFHKHCEQRACYRCYCPGHLARDCQERTVPKGNPCFRCGRNGHSQRTCPDQWRQYHLTTNIDSPQKGRNKKNPRKYCYNCAEEGHFGYDCEEQRMDRYSVCSYPFVQRYDFSTKRKSTKRKANKGNEESSEKKAKRTKMEKSVLKEDDSFEEGKKKKSKKLKRIYERLETERLEHKGKKKKSVKLKKQTRGSEGGECLKLMDDKRSVKENIETQTFNPKKSKDKKSKKLKRIYDRINTEKQKKNDDKKRLKGKEGPENCNSNWQRMKNSIKGSTKSDVRNNRPRNRKNSSGFNGIPINASNGFKTKLNVIKQ